MEKKAAYATLAEWFEYLNDDCGYEQWSQYLIEKLRAFPVKTGLDAGCGGGWFTRAFARAGYAVTGMDISPEMLDVAQRKALSDGVKGEYLLGDIVKTKLPKRFDFVTAINDCVNYIPKEKLRSAFKNVRSALNKKGIFLFDVSSERKFREKIANTVSVDDREDVTYLCFHRTEDEKTTMDVTLFVKKHGRGYERLDERHVQYIYKEVEILAALNECGFDLLCAEGFLGEDKEHSDRLCFLAQKR